MDDNKKKDILSYGKYSRYWEEFVIGLPWDKESTETKFYVAGVLNGFSHDFVLRKMAEQSMLHGDNFRNMGFFMWIEFFSDLKQKSTSAQINIQGDVIESTIIIGNENKVKNSKE